MSVLKKIHNRFRRIQWNLQNLERAIVLRRARLSYRLRSDLLLPIESWADWSVFTDIFVEGDYDEAIIDTLRAATPGETISVADLGANVGFFTLRFLHQRRILAPEVSSHVWQIEANPKTFPVLKKRLESQSLDPREQLTTTLGAVGERSGTAMLWENPFHAMTGLAVGKQRGNAETKFIDLDQLFRSAERIDLLKCDIEGGEQKFLENYPDLLTRVDRLVIEIHKDRCDQGRCLALIESAGLSSRKRTVDNEWISMHYYARETAGGHR